MSDLISRQAAIDRINKQREHLRPDIYEQDYIGDAAYKICAEFIERLPSAYPGIDPQKLLKAIYKHPLLGEYEKAVITEIVDKLQEGEKADD